MPLKIALKAGERLIVGGAVLTNGSGSCELVVENDVPVLRGREVLSLADANSPCRRIYFTVQLMYVDEANVVEHHRLYWELVRDLLAASPSLTELVGELSSLILARRYYQALKVGRRLIDQEQELMDHAAAPRA